MADRVDWALKHLIVLFCIASVRSVVMPSVLLHICVIYLHVERLLLNAGRDRKIIKVKHKFARVCKKEGCSFYGSQCSAHNKKKQKNTAILNLVPLTTLGRETKRAYLLFSSTDILLSL